MKKKIRSVFIGGKELGFKALKILINKNNPPLYVVGNLDDRWGRKYSFYGRLLPTSLKVWGQGRNRNPDQNFLARAFRVRV